MFKNKMFFFSAAVICTAFLFCIEAAAENAAAYKSIIEKNSSDGYNSLKTDISLICREFDTLPLAENYEADEMTIGRISAYAESAKRFLPMTALRESEKMKLSAFLTIISEDTAAGAGWETLTVIRNHLYKVRDALYSQMPENAESAVIPEFAGDYLLGYAENSEKGYSLLENKYTVNLAKAAGAAEAAIGRNARLRTADYMGFPPARMFMCENAFAFVSTSGGYLMSMGFEKEEGGKLMSIEECRLAAKAFLEKWGIKGAIPAAEYEMDGITFFEFSANGRSDMRVLAGVSRSNLKICHFNASQYYRNR